MWRKAAALALVLAPIALTVATGLDPALGDNQGYGIYRAHPDAIQWHSLLLHWAWALFVPGFLGLLLPVRRRGAVLAAVAWVAVVLGLVTFSALMASDFALLAREQAGLTDAQLAAVDDRFGALGWATWGWQAPGLLGWALSLVLVPVAAARARVISWWVAGLALAGAALYFLFAIEPVPLCLIGPALLVVAYGMGARQLITHKSPVEPDVFGAFRRRAGTVALVAAPLSLAIGTAFFLHLGWVLFIPAVLALAERGRHLTRIAAAVTVLGLVNFSGLMVGDYVDVANRAVLDAATVERIDAAMGGYLTFSLGWVLPGMVLTLLGLAAVPIAAAVEGVVRWWVPVLVGAGVVAFLATPAGPVAAVGPLLMAAGFGAAALPALRIPRPAPAPV
ncbi:hypothetical protein ACQPZX_48710 [Actinoplanes sp. CA-142083]|uniref:hypothetical protein n=1 Tax=Actinoplanes sp. CA-142083 TaxID=3239903 RepID=UPI003D914D13